MLSIYSQLALFHGCDPPSQRLVVRQIGGRNNMTMSTFCTSLCVKHAMLGCPCRALKSHPHAGRELVPHYSQLLPAMTLFKHCHQKLWLPPPHCLPATGSFSGGSPDAWLAVEHYSCGIGFA